MRILVLVFVVITLGTHCSFANPQQALQSFGDHQVFIKPEILKYARPVYPLEAHRDESAALVEVAFMVDSDGKPYELTVVQSNDSVFNDAALQAVRKYKFNPASLDSNAVDSRFTMGLLFMMDGQYNYVPKSDARRLKKIQKRISSDNADQNAIEKDIFWLIHKKSTTYCGEAHAYFALQQLAQSVQNTELEITALRALRYYAPYRDQSSKSDDRWHCFVEPLNQSILIRLLTLLFTQERHAEAFRILVDLDNQNSQSRSQLLIESMPQHFFDMSQLAPSSKQFEIAGSGFQFIEVLGRKLELQQKDEGDLESAKLRCDAGFMQVELTESTEIEIPPAFGRCQVQVIGEAGTRFELTESSIR